MTALSKQDSKLIDSLRVALADYAESTELLDKLAKRPLVRWYVCRMITQEAAAAGGIKVSEVDWDKLAAFLIAIAPIIIEILKMFL